MSDFQYNPFDMRVGIIDPLEADRQSNKWHKVKFDPPFTANKLVVVIPMTQTYKGRETPGLRIKSVTPKSFQIRFDEVVYSKGKSDGNHINESVGWVAYGL